MQLPCCINQANRYISEIDGRTPLLANDCTVVSTVCNVPTILPPTTELPPTPMTSTIYIPSSGARATVLHWTVVLTLLASCATVWSH